MWSNVATFYTPTSKGLGVRISTYLLMVGRIQPLALPRLNSRCLQGWTFIWKLWGRIHIQAHSSCWQNPVPCRCRKDVSVSLLAVSQGLLSATRGHQYSSSCGYPPLQASNCASNPSHVCNLSDSPPFCPPARENALLLKGSYN